MPDWIAWLLNVRLPSGAPAALNDRGFALSFALGIPAWAWALIALGAALVAWWSYRRIEGPRWARAALAGARAGLLLLIVILLSGPKLVRTSETIERDWVLMLLDRSASLQVPDVTLEGTAQRSTREAQLRTALSKSAQSLASLAKDRVVAWIGFDSAAYDLPLASASGLPDLKTPAGPRTSVAAAIEAALAKAAARPISGIVLFTDGRASEPLPKSLTRKLTAAGVKVFPVPLGSAEPLADLSTRQVDAPTEAFIRDTVPITATIDLSGPTSKALPITVQLIDTSTGAVLDQQQISLSASESERSTAQVALTAKPQVESTARWAIRLKTDATPLLRDPVDTPVTINLIDRPLRVLYLDGYPRWEYRYLKNILARERSVTFAALILAPSRRYLQEGTQILPAVPSTPKEWDQFDVIVMGDVHPEVFSKAQIEQLRRRVAVGGAGLLWIAGQGPTPSAWRSTALGDLVPFQSSEGFGAEVTARAFDEEVTLSPTPLADRLGVLRLSEVSLLGSFWPPAISDPATGWSRLRWAQRIDPALLKPATEVLATVSPISNQADASPALLSMRFGAGRVLYVATDEIWRWRYGRGEDLPERFWLQLIRLLGRDAVARSGKPAILQLSPARSIINQPVTVTAQLLDQSLLDARPRAISVRLKRVGGLPGASGDDTADALPTDLTLRPTATASPGDVTGASSFSAVWVPTQSGIYQASITDALLSSAKDPVTAQAEVFLPDDELRFSQTDHKLLAQLAKDTDGRVIQPASLDQLAQVLPRREVRLPGAGQELTLWDSPAALIALVLLLALEWVGRRLIRLI